MKIIIQVGDKNTILESLARNKVTMGNGKTLEFSNLSKTWILSPRLFLCVRITNMELNTIVQHSDYGLNKIFRDFRRILNRREI
jgi:hypothetical protein